VSEISKLAQCCKATVYNVLQNHCKYGQHTNPFADIHFDRNRQRQEVMDSSPELTGGHHLFIGEVSVRQVNATILKISVNILDE
jgi:hypothetical protein